MHSSDSTMHNLNWKTLKLHGLLHFTVRGNITFNAFRQKISLSLSLSHSLFSLFLLPLSLSLPLLSISFLFLQPSPSFPPAFTSFPSVTKSISFSLCPASLSFFYFPSPSFSLFIFSLCLTQAVLSVSPFSIFSCLFFSSLSISCMISLPLLISLSLTTGISLSLSSLSFAFAISLCSSPSVFLFLSSLPSILLSFYLSHFLPYLFPILIFPYPLLPFLPLIDYSLFSLSRFCSLILFFFLHTRHIPLCVPK